MHTNTAILNRFGVNDIAIEYPDLEVPVLSATQRQGDVLVLKVTTAHAGDPIGKGVTVVRSERDSANTHTLHGEGLWEANPRASVTDLVQGWITVAEADEAFLIHTEEHNAIGLGAGTYEIRRQREFAGEWAYVAD